MVIILLSESVGNGPKRLCRKAFCISGAYSHSARLFKYQANIVSISSFVSDSILLVEDVFDYSTIFSIVPVSRSNLSGHLCGHLSGHGNHNPAAEFVGASTPDLSIFFEGGDEAAYLTFTQAKLLCHAGDGHVRICLQ